MNVSVRFHVPLECRVRWQALLLCLVFRVRLEPTSIVPNRLIGTVKISKIAAHVLPRAFSERALRFCAARLTTLSARSDLFALVTQGIPKALGKELYLFTSFNFLRYISWFNRVTDKGHGVPRS